MKLTSQVGMVLGLCCGVCSYAVERPIVVCLSSKASAALIKSVESQKYSNYKIVFGSYISDNNNEIYLRVDNDDCLVGDDCLAKINEAYEKLDNNSEIFFQVDSDDLLPSDDTLARVDAAYKKLASN